MAISSTALMLGMSVMAVLLLVTSRQPHPSALWLVLTVAAVLAMGAADLSTQLGAHTFYRVLKPLGDAALLLIGPALWLYVRQMGSTRAAAPRRLSTMLHLLPAALVFLLLVADAFSAPPAERETLRTTREILSLSPIAVQLAAYAIALMFRVSAIRRRTLASYSDLEGRELTWIPGLTLLYMVALAVWMLTWRWPVSASNALTGLFIAAAVAWIGIRGARQRAAVDVKAEIEDEPAAPADPEPAPLSAPAAIDAPPAQPAYRKARLSEDRITDIAQRLSAAMRDDKAWLESDLTLAELATRVGATSHQLSQYLSTIEQQSFHDYVNRWRVEAVKATLLRAGSARRPLMEIALECGFGSKSAFNTVFKRATGFSPSDYRAGLPGTAARAATPESGAPPS